MDIKELTRIVKENGVVGAGGAGFPTYAKLDKRANTIILDCAECEPLLKVHRQLLEKYAYEIMSTLDMIAKTIEASTVIIAVKAAYTKTVDALKSHQDSYPDIHIKLLPEVYPMGDEVVLIYETLGKVVAPGSIPLEQGVIVLNVETVLNIYKAVHDNEPVYTKYLTIAGEVKSPVTVKVPIGISVQEAIELAGGTLIKDPAFIMGGPMTGNLVNPYDPITKTTNAILVLPKNLSVIRKKTTNTSIDMKRAMSVCCQCQMCTDLCPRHQLGQPITPHMFMRAATSGVTKNLEPFLNTYFCCSCGVCEMYACPQQLSPRKLMIEYKKRLRQRGVLIPKGIPLKEVDPLRKYRQIPMDRLIARLGLEDYNVDAPLVENDTEKLKRNIGRPSRENADGLILEAAGVTKRVKITLNQHIGARSHGIVNQSDRVKQGDVIAVAEDEKLSLPVHASIDGVVQEVNEKFIIINATSEYQISSK